MGIEPGEKIILELCKVSLTPEYPVGYWASADTLALPAVTRLLGLPFLECWRAGMTSAKYGKLSGSQQIVITRQNRAKLRLCYLQKLFLSRIVVYTRDSWDKCHLHQPGLPGLLLLIARNRVQRPFPSCSVPNLPCVSPQHPAVHCLSFERIWKA